MSGKYPSEATWDWSFPHGKDFTSAFMGEIDTAHV